MKEYILNIEKETIHRQITKMALSNIPKQTQ